MTSSSIAEIALEYHRRGWRVIPLDGKRPTRDGWQNTQYDETELRGIFGGKNRNIGVVLGQPSGGLADVDLDCAEALSLASVFLPKTHARFGRKSSSCSHWLYTVDSSGFKTQRLADPDDERRAPGDHKGTIVELRSDGSQTMMPPSIHPLGETVEWESDFSSTIPATVNLEELRAAVLKLAAGCLIVRRWGKLPRHDTTLALAGALLHGGLSADDATQFVLAVADDDEPDDRRRAVDDTIKKFNAGEPIAGATKCRELFGERAWSKIAEWLKLHNAGEWEAVDASIVNGCRNAAPELPLDGLGERWSSWVLEQASLKSAPPDYVFAALVTGSASLIGNARAVSPWPGWAEPSILWGARVGGPSSGKSPAADPVHSLLHDLERELAEGHPEKLRQWEQACARARAERKQWESNLKNSVKEGGSEAGELPSAAFEPDQPRWPHLLMIDATIEALAYNLAGRPKGMLQVRDELAGWLEGFGRYGAGKQTSDRAFWIEGYGGRSFKIDRVSHKEKPWYIPALSISIDGGIQPDKLARLLLDGDDDGLPARFFYVWPDPVPIERPSVEKLSSPALDALRKLRDLSMESRRVLRLSDDAADRFHKWRVVNAELVGEHSGMFQSWLGKLPGVVLRVALVLRYLRWCAEDGTSQEPENIDLDTTLAALRLVDDYLIPMARRVYGDAALPEAETDAAAIARLIVARKVGAERGGRYIVNLRKDVQRRGINRIRTANQARCALEELREAGWLRPVAVPTGGRPRGDYEVNPEALKVEAFSARRARTDRPPSAPWRARKAKF